MKEHTKKILETIDELYTLFETDDNDVEELGRELDRAYRWVGLGQGQDDCPAIAMDWSLFHFDLAHGLGLAVQDAGIDLEHWNL